jgi:hypothetical protein
MPVKQEPNIGINYGWDAGESGIKLQLDENWKTIGALLQLSVLSRTEGVPASPVDGDRYVVPIGATGAWSGHDGKVARYNENGWELYTPMKGWLSHIQDVDKYAFFNGATWEFSNFDSADNVTYSNTVSNLTATELQSAIDELVVMFEEGGGGVSGVSSVNGSTGDVDLSNTYEKKRKNNLVATTNPSPVNDITQGYEPLSRWVNTATTTGEFFVCLSNANGNAKWQQASLTLDELGSAALTDASDYVPVVPGKQLSDENYTLIEKGKLSGVEVGSQKNITLTKEIIDPLDVDAATVNNKTVESNVPIGAVFTDTTYDGAIQALVEGKVDLESGKQLSDENYTLAEKNKLANLTSGGTSNVDSYSKVESDARFAEKIQTNLIWDGVSDQYSTDQYSRDGFTSSGVTPIHEGMRRCVMTDDGVVAYYLDGDDSNSRQLGGLSDLTGVSGQVMVEIPKFYVRVSQLSNGKWKREISQLQFPGFVLHPAFAIADVPYYDSSVGMWHYQFLTGERDAFYVGAYQATVYLQGSDFYEEGYNYDDSSFGVDTTTDKLASVSGKNPMVGLTRDEFRKLAVNRGVGWQQMDFWQWQAIKFLFFIEYGSFDGQSMLSNGNVSTGSTYPPSSYNELDSPHTTSGASNAIGNGSGGVDSTNFKTAYMTYRGIENFWGNASEWVDGVSFRDNFCTVCNNPSLFADNSGTGYSYYGVVVPTTNGYIRNVQHNTLADLPSDVSGNSSTGFADYMTQLTGWMAVHVGGNAVSGLTGGPSCFDFSTDATVRSRTISARLAKR